MNPPPTTALSDSKASLEQRGVPETVTLQFGDIQLEVAFELGREYAKPLAACQKGVQKSSFIEQLSEGFR